MFWLTKPSDKHIQDFLDARRSDNFSYSAIGASRQGGVPNGYNVDHNRIQIGSGPEDFAKAIFAVQNWKMFETSWTKLCWTNTPIKIGETVAVLVHHFNFWSLNASRIVYLIEERDGEIEKYGFAYGTLTEHGEEGEERFTAEFDRKSGEVWYDLFAFSKPKHIMAQIGYPLSRMLQKQFAVESKTSMLRFVREASAARVSSLENNCL